MKKFFSIFLAVAMVLSSSFAIFVPVSAEMIDSGTTGDCTWRLDGTTLTISGNGAMADEDLWPYLLTEVIIEPGVTSIGAYTFSYCDKLKMVTIPDSVTSIGKHAFSGCSNLTNITIPDSVTSIGEYAFSGCSNLTNITIPESVTSIGRDAFYGCGWKNISIPDGLINIGDGAFYLAGTFENNNLTIPDGVVSIGRQAFGCCGIESITIPASVRSVGEDAFSENFYLSQIVFEGDAIEFVTDVFNWNDVYVVGVPEIKVYYPANNSTWTEDVLQSFRDASWLITLIPYEAEEDKSTVEEWNVSLEDALKVNFYLDAGIAETEMVTVTVGKNTYTTAVSSLAKDENGRPVVSVPVAAAQMTDEITVRVQDLQPMVYTVRQYCDTILADENQSKYHQLVKEMLNYGAMAQKYFDYNSTKLANEGITGVGTAEVPETAADMVISGGMDDIAFSGASLVCRDRIAVRYYFTGDVNDMTFTANGATYKPVAKDGLYYIEVGEILPQDLEQQITLTVCDSSGNTLTITYGPMNYIVRMNQKGSEDTKALLKALYNYHLAAKEL